MMLRHAATNACARRALSASISSCTKKLTSTPNKNALLRSFAPSSSAVVFSQHVRSLSAGAASTTSAVPDAPDMFCRQCEQAKDGVGCTTIGVCGKTPETSAAQDALIHFIKSVSAWCVAARQVGATPEELSGANVWSVKAAFSTLTNVNFSETGIADIVKDGMEVKSTLEDLVAARGGQKPEGELGDLSLSPDIPLDELEAFGKSVGVLERRERMGHDDAYALNELATAGAKGVSAYAAHCAQLGFVDDVNVMAPLHEVWAKLGSNEPDFEGLLATCLRVGEINAHTLSMLDNAHATTFGAPEPTDVCLTAVQGKAILVSGHDLKDLHALLEQTEGKNINVFTHGEMLPAHSYPELKKFKHLAGNYGTAWQNQKFEFATFPGPIVVTTNCILEPRRAYKNRIFSMNEVGVDGVKHVGEDRDFSDVIEMAASMKGFPKTIDPARHHTVGFNHRAVVPLADKVIDAAKSGDLSRIFLIGGCDGTEWDRSYFSDLAEETPSDSLILTMGCAKNRLIGNPKLVGATLPNGMPRLLDMGQCNDSFSAVVVAQELAKSLDCGINDLPLSLAVSHLEQKAAAVLLTLLHLGVKNIRLGPKLPAYITPNVLEVLKENYNLMATGDAGEDLKAMMAGK